MGGRPASILETIGKTRIGLAMVCAAKGHPLVLVTAESFSIERDTGERYLSTPLCDDVPAEMTEEDQSIARSVANAAKA